MQGIQQAGTHDKAYSLLLKILAGRGIEGEARISEYLSASPQETYSPFLLPNMEAAADFVISAVDGGKAICIFGDYDVDGVTATSLLYLFLSELGAKPSFYIPRRMEEGYGLSKAALDAVKELGAECVITVDCGSVSLEEVDYAKEIGLDILVTDHHDLIEGQLPDCILISPKLAAETSYPNAYLSGCGVAFKLAQAVAIRLGEKCSLKKFIRDAVDLVAVSTVADVMPLCGENRTFVKYGLRLLREGRRAAFKELLACAGIAAPSLTCRDIAFGIAPRINAIGRIGAAASGVQLFITEDSEERLAIAREMQERNSERRSIQGRCFNDCLQLLEEDSDGQGGYIHSFQLLLPEHYHEGISGIVAGKIREVCGLPAAVLAPSETEDGSPAYKGSARSAGRLELMDLLRMYADVFTRLGGHSKAAGFSFEVGKLDEIRDLLSGGVDELLARDPALLEEGLSVDIEAAADDITMELAQLMELMEPFGAGNPSPLISVAVADGAIGGIQGIGQSGAHARFTLKSSSDTIRCIYFGGYAELMAKAAAGEVSTLIATPEVNRWNGRESLQLNVRSVL